MKFQFKVPKLMVLFSLILLAGAFAYAVSDQIGKNGDNQSLPGTTNTPNEPDPIAENDGDDVEPLKKYVLLDVPFTSQAPNANWSDPRQQDGCEEASVLMAWMWINGHTMSKNNAEKAIIAMSEFQEQRYGNFIDTDAHDTARLLREHFSHTKVEVQMNPTIYDIKLALSNNKLVIVPANGQKLGNPNFTGAGPYTHMFVIKGFDDSKQQFITNDPGTRNGEGYIYKYDTVYNAMVNYPSGNHLSQAGRPKAMIVVEK